MFKYKLGKISDKKNKVGRIKQIDLSLKYVIK